MRDADLRQDVQSALERDALDASSIAVAADGGVITLRGDVRTRFEKHDAERIALRVFGVEAVANELVVRTPDKQEPTDTEIARAVVDALISAPLVPLHQVHVSVADRWVTLSGTLEWEYQSVVAERAAGKVFGVKGVSNAIVLKRPAAVETSYARSA
jgi:osmotically-inducible protein OsmY